MDGRTVNRILFSGGSDLTLYTVYVPLQREWGDVRLFGRIGASVYARDGRKVAGRVQNGYNFGFIRFQSPEDPTQETGEREYRDIGGTRGFDPVNLQYGRVGVTVPIGQATVRTHVEVERLHVRGLSRTWSYDVQLEVGLPF